MVLRGPELKYKAGNLKETLSRLASKMASPGTSQLASWPPSQRTTQRASISLTHSLNTQNSDVESDSESGKSLSIPQSGMFKQFEIILKKALKQTSDHITDKLTKRDKGSGTENR